MENHIRAVVFLWILKVVLGLLFVFILLSVLLGVGVFAGIASGDEIVLPIMATIGLVLGIILWFLSIPNIIAGIGIIKYKQWGRILGLIMGALNLMEFPFGTALGIYTFWALLKDETTAFFETGK